MRNKIALMFFLLLIGFSGCKKEDDGTKFSDLNNAPVAFVPKKDLLKWLQDEMNEYIATPGSFKHWVAYKGKWGKQVIYIVYNDIQSCYCDLRYEDGKKIEESFLKDVYSKSKKWTRIYEYIGETFNPEAKKFSISEICTKSIKNKDDI